MSFTYKAIPTLPVGIHRYEDRLYVRVTDRSRYWVLKYSIGGVRREMGLGATEGQTLAAVTAKAANAKALIAMGVDPIMNKRETAAQVKAKIEEAKRDVFMRTYVPQAVKRAIGIRRYSSAISEKEWERMGKRIVILFGDYKVKDVTPKLIAEKIEEIWTTKPRTGQELISKLSGIFQCAIADGLVDKNPALWKNGLSMYLPPAEKVRRAIPVKHHAAVTPELLRAVCHELWEAQTIPSLCALFGILSAGRSSEFRCAQWGEIDWRSETLSVPTERRKDKRPEPFKVPLSRQMREILRLVEGLDEKLVFPGQASGRPCSLGGIKLTIKRYTDQPITVHGSRSTFSDWCMQNEKNYIVSEKCLMHAVGNKVFQAYQRDDLLEQRRVLMQEWADYLLPEL